MNDIEVTAQRQADELVGEFVQHWLDGEQDGEFWSYMDMAVQAVARGLGPDDVIEESFERSHARHHGDAPDSAWGALDEARSERARTYDLPRPEEVIALLAEHGITVRGADLI